MSSLEHLDDAPWGFGSSQPACRGFSSSSSLTILSSASLQGEQLLGAEAARWKVSSSWIWGPRSFLGGADLSSL